MRKIIFVLIILVFSQSGICSDSIKNSKIIIYREARFYCSAVQFKIYINDSLVTKIKNNSYYTYSCSSGEYDIESDKITDTKIHLKVKENETYFVRFGWKNGSISKLELTSIDNAIANPIINNGKIRELNIINNTLKRPKNRFGINIGLGGGFKDFPMYMMDNGNESKISFGGGALLGLNYGHEFSKHFDISIDLNNKISLLKPTLNNAEVSFERINISLTPSYILPINDGENMRVRVGLGPDFYINPTLDINGDKISGGFKDVWKYKNTFGLHSNINFEFNLFHHWSVIYELNCHLAQFKYKSGDFVQPTLKELKEPNGNGIDFKVGFFYCFK